MTLSNMLFGEFPVSYATDLPVSEAVGRLSGATDQVRPVERRGLSKLSGYATTHEVVLWRETSNQLTPFQPVFRGRFVLREGTGVERPGGAINDRRLNGCAGLVESSAF